MAGKQKLEKFVYVINTGKMFVIEAPNLAEAMGLAWKLQGANWRNVVSVLSETTYTSLSGKKLR